MGEEENRIPDTGAVFTFGQSRFAENIPSHFFIRNDPIVDISCGDEHTMVVCQNGRVFGFGGNEFGQLGLGTTSPVSKPSCVKSLKPEKVKSIVCGKSHSLALTGSGKLFVWGKNDDCQLGIGSEENSLSPRQLELNELNEPIANITAGDQHTAFLTSGGKVFIWGSNSCGQLGMGDGVKKCNKPTLLTIKEKVLQIACGYWHTLLLTEDKYLLVFGEGSSGKLGLGGTSSVPMPIPLKFNKNVCSIAAGGHHSLASTDEGDVYAWGNNEHGQLGFSQEKTEITNPILITPLLNVRVVQIACGDRHSAFLSDDGELYTCGESKYGKLCSDSESKSDIMGSRTLPFKVNRFKTLKVQEVACGGHHTMVLALPSISNKQKHNNINGYLDQTNKENEMTKKSLSDTMSSDGLHDISTTPRQTNRTSLPPLQKVIAPPREPEDSRSNSPTLKHNDSDKLIADEEPEVETPQESTLDSSNTTDSLREFVERKESLSNEDCVSEKESEEKQSNNELCEEENKHETSGNVSAPTSDNVSRLFSSSNGPLGKKNSMSRKMKTRQHNIEEKLKRSKKNSPSSSLSLEKYCGRVSYVCKQNYSTSLPCLNQSSTFQFETKDKNSLHNVTSTSLMSKQILKNKSQKLDDTFEGVTYNIDESQVEEPEFKFSMSREKDLEIDYFHRLHENFEVDEMLMFEKRGSSSNKDLKNDDMEDILYNCWMNGDIFTDSLNLNGINSSRSTDRRDDVRKNEKALSDKTNRKEHFDDSDDSVCEESVDDDDDDDDDDEIIHFKEGCDIERNNFCVDASSSRSLISRISTPTKRKKGNDLEEVELDKSYSCNIVYDRSRTFYNQNVDFVQKEEDDSTDNDDEFCVISSLTDIEESDNDGYVERIDTEVSSENIDVCESLKTAKSRSLTVVQQEFEDSENYSFIRTPNFQSDYLNREALGSPNTRTNFNYPDDFIHQILENDDCNSLDASEHSICENKFNEKDNFYATPKPSMIHKKDNFMSDDKNETSHKIFNNKTFSINNTSRIEFSEDSLISKSEPSNSKIHHRCKVCGSLLDDNNKSNFHRSSFKLKRANNRLFNNICTGLKNIIQKTKEIKAHCTSNEVDSNVIDNNYYFERVYENKGFVDEMEEEDEIQDECEDNYVTSIEDVKNNCKKITIERKIGEFELKLVGMNEPGMVSEDTESTAELSSTVSAISQESEKKSEATVTKSTVTVQDDEIQQDTRKSDEEKSHTESTGDRREEKAETKNSQGSGETKNKNTKQKSQKGTKKQTSSVCSIL